MVIENHRSIRQRVIELAVGLGIVLVAIVITRVWVELKNARRADDNVLRQGVARTLASAEQYHVNGGDLGRQSEDWKRFLASPPGQPLSARAAHEFVDSFVVSYRDGTLDSVETTALYHQLMSFRPSAH